MKGEALSRNRKHWLRRHDQQTNGLPGVFPCVFNLPVRFTHSVDPERKIFKFTVGRLLGWELQDVDHARVQACTDAEMVLKRLPKLLFVK